MGRIDWQPIKHYPEAAGEAAAAWHQAALSVNVTSMKRCGGGGGGRLASLGPIRSGHDANPKGSAVVWDRFSAPFVRR